MITKIDAIEKFGIFTDFDWDVEVLTGRDGKAKRFTDVNIIYGENYSGKTTLSRIIRSLEKRELPIEYSGAEFSIEFKGSPAVTHADLPRNDKVVRVFNEDFVKENLYFLSNSEKGIRPFGILGASNIKTMKQIEAIEKSLGSDESGAETGMYLLRRQQQSSHQSVLAQLEDAQKSLGDRMSFKVNDRKAGLRYNSNLFGDQNYNTRKLKREIHEILEAAETKLNSKKREELRRLCMEEVRQPVDATNLPEFSFGPLMALTAELVSRPIGKSQKILQLVQNAALHRWAHKGKGIHQHKLENCAFCGNHISEQRWRELEMHFDHEIDNFEAEIQHAITLIVKEKDLFSPRTLGHEPPVYPAYRSSYMDTEEELGKLFKLYQQSLEELHEALKSRFTNIFKPMVLHPMHDHSNQIQQLWKKRDKIIMLSNQFGEMFAAKKSEAQTLLRRDAILEFMETIGYEEAAKKIAQLRVELDYNSTLLEAIHSDIDQLIKQRSFLHSQLRDEHHAVELINRHLENSLRENQLKLRIAPDFDGLMDANETRFEVTRNGERAHHLSEGERSLIAFCYFVARLSDIETASHRPIVWIDDPISSLDENHIFFIYSLILSEIIRPDRFSQFFVTTHNLHFLKYLNRIWLKAWGVDKANANPNKAYFVLRRTQGRATIREMPRYLSGRANEFIYLFEQIHKCATIEEVDDSNYHIVYNFGNSARKFLELYASFKYPHLHELQDILEEAFGEEQIPKVLVERVAHEYSHSGRPTGRAVTPITRREIHSVAQHLLEFLKRDPAHYKFLLRSIGVHEES